MILAMGVGLVGRRAVPPDHPRVLQGAAVPRLRQRDSRRPPRAGDAAVRRADAEDPGHRHHLRHRRAGDRGHAVLRRVLQQGHDPRPRRRVRDAGHACTGTSQLVLGCSSCCRRSSRIVTAFYMTRCWMLTFWGKPRISICTITPTRRRSCGAAGRAGGAERHRRHDVWACSELLERSIEGNDNVLPAIDPRLRRLRTGLAGSPMPRPMRRRRDAGARRRRQAGDRRRRRSREQPRSRRALASVEHRASSARSSSASALAFLIYRNGYCDRRHAADGSRRCGGFTPGSIAGCTSTSCTSASSSRITMGLSQLGRRSSTGTSSMAS